MDGPMQAPVSGPLKCFGEARPGSPSDGLIPVNRQAYDSWVAAFDHPFHKLDRLASGLLA